MLGCSSRIPSRIILALTVLSGCSQGAMAEEPVPRPVISVVVGPDRSTGLSFAGVVQPRVETELAFRTLGRVVSRRVDVGDLVRKGDVVAEIDPLALELAVRRAEADLRDAKAQLDNAVLTERRKHTLASTNTGSIADLDLAEQGLNSAEASVAQAQASLDKARQQLGYAQLPAEFDGVVTASSVEVGQIVTVGQTVLKLARLDQRDVVVDLSEAQLGSLRVGSRFEVALQLDGTIRTPGILREIGPEADSDTRTHRLKIGVDEAPGVFRLGSVVTAMPADDRQDGAIMLPATAILKKDGAGRVWVVDRTTHTVALKSVRLETRSEGAQQVRILDGLQDGDEVVVVGVNELVEGQKVRLGQEPQP